MAMENGRIPMSPASEPVKLEKGVPCFFFDDAYIAGNKHLTRNWLPADICPEPVIRPDRPWEGRTIVLHGSVVQAPENGKYRLYYHSVSENNESSVCVAVSEDGFAWRKPEVGLFEYHGSRDNNIVLRPELRFDSPSVLYDPKDKERPYKLIQFEFIAWPWRDGNGKHVYFSRDGYAWGERSGIVLEHGDRCCLMGDRQDGQYVLYCRRSDMFERFGERIIYRSQSDDFINWTQPEPVLVPDLEDDADVEFYGMPVFRRHGWYLGLLEYWRSDADTIEIHLAYSRDGKQWMRPFPRKPFISPTYQWNRKKNSCASNGPLFIGEQMVFYFGGGWTAHDFDSACMHTAIGYAALPLDRFCAIEGQAGGVMETVPLLWPGGDLAVNADTRESYRSHPLMCNGSIRVEALDAQGHPLAAWSGDASAVFSGNTHCRRQIRDGRVLWPGGRSLDGLTGSVIRLRLHLKHARLFTIAAQDATNAPR